MQKTKEKAKFYATTPGSGIATGIGLGLLFGVMFENMAIGVAIGIALGVSFESWQRRDSRPQIKPKSSRKR